MAGIYIHIPFCRQFCHYCDFYSSRALGRRPALIEAILREMEAEREFIPDRHIETLYFGGGTPSVCAPADLQRVIDRVRTLWEVAPHAEITAEANPDDLTPAYMDALAATEINRLSIGIQSFLDRDLRLMNRRHTAAAAIKAVRRAQAAGFDNLTIDLIYGIPGMSDAEWEYNLKEAVKLDVSHISAYHLTIEKDSRFGKMVREGTLVPVDEATSERHFRTLRDRLGEAGYEHYEISNFARPGFAAQHNSAYWQGKNYLGLGPAAHSYNGRERRWSLPSLTKYLAVRDPSGTASAHCYKTEILTPDDHYNEFLMTRLRTAAGIDLAEMEARFGAAAPADFNRAARQHIANGNLVREGNRIRIPPSLFLISDYLIAGLLK